MLTQRKILSFWLPLAASWALMTLEIPIVQASISRLPSPQLAIAAFGIVTSLSLTIESPVIMLLSTTTALVSDSQAYRALRRFTLLLLGSQTVLTVLVGYTPLFDWLVLGLMAVPREIGLAARPGMQIMILWTAAIGWRRFQQGILIRYGQTRRVGYGTMVRLLSSGGTALGLLAWGELPGVTVGGCALMAGVLSEALFVTYLARPTIRRHLSGPDPDKTEPLSLGKIARFHTPLAATSLLTLLAQPLIGAGLARMVEPDRSLAAWPLVYYVANIVRSIGYSLPEVVIALLDGKSSYSALRRFCLTAAAAALLILGLVVFSPLIFLYLRLVLSVPANLVTDVVPAIRLGVGIPFLTALGAFPRGVLVKNDRTLAVYQSMGLHILILGLGLALGVLVRGMGVNIAALALSAGLLAEYIFLQIRARAVTRN